MRSIYLKVRGEPIVNFHISYLDKVTVIFEDETSMCVPANQVRVLPALALSAEPTVGDLVEVYVPGTTTSPGGWSLAHVTAIKSSFYFISIDGSTHTMIVERESIRSPISPECILNLSGYVREETLVPQDAVPWARSEQAKAVFDQVCLKTGALLIEPVLTANRLSIIGPKTSVGRARLLLGVHLTHQGRMHTIRPLAYIRPPPVNSISFEVSDELVGLMIGKKGSKIHRISNTHGVSIKVSDFVHDTSKKRVTISGQPTEILNIARDEFCFEQRKYKIENPSIIGMVIGKQRANIDDIVVKAGLYRANINSHKSEIEFIGTKEAVDNAIMLIESHIEYYTEFDAIRHNRREIDTPECTPPLNKKPPTVSRRRRKA